MFWTRLLSGIVLLVIALATFSFGNIFLAVPLWLISLIAYRELTKALRCATDEKKFNALEWIGFVGVTAYYATLFFTRDHTLLLMCIVGLFMAEMFCYVVLFPKYEASQVMAAVFSFLYAPVLLSFVYLTRECENGIYLVWLILISSWGCDTCAYVVGKLIGKKHIFPELSGRLYRRCRRGSTDRWTVCTFFCGDGIPGPDNYMDHCLYLCCRCSDEHGRRSGGLCHQEEP